MVNEKKCVWVVAFSDNKYCYVGETALFSNEEDAKKCFEERKATTKIDYMEDVEFWDEDDTDLIGYADPYANDTVCILAYFKRELDGKWQGNLDW